MCEAHARYSQMAGYHQWKGGGGTFEVFWGFDLETAEGNPLPRGWYWWACQPGCLPDSDPEGPFETSGRAYNSAVAS